MNNKLFFNLLIALQLSWAIELLPSINSFSPNRNTDAFDVIGIMVDFQLDDNIETSGNGKFLRPSADQSTDEYIKSITNYINYTSQYRCNNDNKFLLDKPPHDVGYFEQQLIAVKNYYNKIAGTESSDIYSFDTHMLQQTYTLSEPMSYYATSDDKIGLLFAESLELAQAEINQKLNQLSLTYDDVLFVVFHAGLGQEASESFDPTIYDIKSAYVDNEMLDLVPEDYAVINELGIGEDFSGGIVMPETMNWIYYDVIEDIYPNDLFSYGDLENLYCDIQFGMTGLFAYLLGYHFGFHPLHNIENGTTRIGQFGLMDVGFYNWNGIIPSRPSAWTRLKFGLYDYFEDLSDEIFSDNIASPTISPIDQIYKIRISENEYFLIEYRENETTDEDQSLQCIIDEDSQYVNTYCSNSDNSDYDESTDDYKNIFDIIGNPPNPDMFVVDNPYNVVTEVEDYDIGLPGEVGKGFLIWHINETNFHENLEGINNDINNKVVALEEGDGINNIGNPDYLIFGDNSKGWVYDFWNIENIQYQLMNYGSYDESGPVLFSKSSFPNSKTDSGLDSFIKLEIESSGIGFNVKYVNNFEDYYTSDLIGGNIYANLQVIGNDGSGCLFYRDSENDIYKYCDSDNCTLPNTDSNDCKIDVGNINVNEKTRIKYNNGIEIIENIDNYIVDSPKGYYDNLELMTIVEDALALGDIDNDGYDEKILINNGNIEAYKYSNLDVLVNGFPIHGEFFGYPLISDLLDHDGNPEIICKNADNISFISSEGEIIHEIPLYNTLADLYIIPQWGNENSYALANGDMLYVFDHSHNGYDISNSYWLNPFSTIDFSSEVSGPLTRTGMESQINIGIDMSKAYNYPNPIKNGQTKFRFYVHNSLSAQIKIYDAAGFLVDELNAGGLLPNRYNEIAWNSSRLDSGLYFAEIQSDRNESKIIKIVIL